MAEENHQQQQQHFVFQKFLADKKQQQNANNISFQHLVNYLMSSDEYSQSQSQSLLTGFEQQQQPYQQEEYEDVVDDDGEEAVYSSQLNSAQMSNDDINELLINEVKSFNCIWD